ncbi:MAG: hypothetical protein P8X80_20760, partial [Desulfobacterales bacterium]
SKRWPSRFWHNYPLKFSIVFSHLFIKGFLGFQFNKHLRKPGWVEHQKCRTGLTGKNQQNMELRANIERRFNTGNL